MCKSGTELGSVNKCVLKLPPPASPTPAPYRGFFCTTTAGEREAEVTGSGYATLTFGACAKWRFIHTQHAILRHRTPPTGTVNKRVWEGADKGKETREGWVGEWRYICKAGVKSTSRYKVQNCVPRVVIISSSTFPLFSRDELPPEDQAGTRLAPARENRVLTFTYMRLCTFGVCQLVQ